MTLLFALTVIGFTIYSELKFRRFSEALDAQIATYRRQRWERPVLRGQAEEGNAAFELQQALRGFSRLLGRDRDALASQLYYSQPLSPSQLALLDKNAERLAKLRVATQRSWAMTDTPVESGEHRNVLAYPVVMDATLLLLAHAARSSPEDCLMIGTDVVRMGQDMVPGASLEAASVAMRMTSVAIPVLLHCASDVGLDPLLRATRELNTLATHPPPTGAGIELADILAEVKLRQMSDLFAEGSGDSLWMRLRRRPALFEAWSYFETPARWRALTPDHYPQALETWLREQEWRTRSELQLVSDATKHVQGWLYDDMRGQALLRSLTVGIATVAERIRQKRTPREPLSLGEPALSDPFNGQPLKWRVAQDGRELAVWSVGEDLRDDKGSSDWTGQAPIDVVVHFKLRPLEDSEQKHTANR